MNKWLNFGGDQIHIAIRVRRALAEACTVPVLLVTGSIARSARRRYLIYSEADFEVFRPAGATRCTDGDEIWHGGGDLLRAKFHPHRCKVKGIGPPKLKFLLRFDKNVEYKRPAVPCAIFTKSANFVPRFSVLAVKISLDLLKGLWSYGVLSWGGRPQIFSAP